MTYMYMYVLNVKWFDFKVIQPAPPTNISIRDTPDGQLKISWLPPRNSSAKVLYYVIQYRTVGL